MSEQKSIYVGNARQINLKDGSGMNVVLNVNELSAAIAEARKEGTEAANARFVSEKGNEYLRLSIFPLKPENVDTKRTHSVKLDTWKPDPAKAPQNAPNQANGQGTWNVAEGVTGSAGNIDDSLPF